MKHKQTELDVDFIGGEGPLTREEEKAISEYIKKQKLLRTKKLLQAKKSLRKTSIHSQKKVTA